MFQQLISYDCYILAFIALVGTIVASIFLLWITQRSRYSAFIKEFRGIVPPFIGIPGILFALNLVFLANDTWIAHDRAQTAVYQEASALRSVMTVATLLPEPNRTRLTGTVERYVGHVITLEWQKLARREIVPVVYQDIAALTALAVSREMADALDRTSHSYLIGQVDKVKEAHSQRVILSRTHINPLKWLGMAILGLVTMISIVMVHVDQIKAELVAVLLFAFAATPTAVIVLVQGNPFQQPTDLLSTPIECVVLAAEACERLP
ncbi:MAG: hypothetical protein WCO00_17705 [Rhodospirillaceae bacterium]